MIEATNIYADRRIPITRNDSFSTVNSMNNVPDVVHQYKDINKYLREKPIFMSNNTTNVRFQNSESIHIGNIVYHIHHHPKKNDNKDSDSIRSDSFGSLTVEAFQDLGNLPPNRIKKKFGFRIIAAIISVILMFISATVASYFALWHKHPGNDK